MPPAIRPPVGDRRGALQLLAFLVLGGDVVPEVLGDELHERLADQARLARARHAGDGREHAERKRDVEVLQVVARDARQAQPALRLRAACAAATLGSPNRYRRVCDCLDAAPGPSGGPL